MRPNSIRGFIYKLTFRECTLWQRAGIGAEPGPDLLLWEHLIMKKLSFALASASLFALAACGETATETAEEGAEAGEEATEEAMEEVEEAAEDAMADVEEAAEGAMEDAEEAAEDAMAEGEEAAEDAM